LEYDQKIEEHQYVGEQQLGTGIKVDVIRKVLIEADEDGQEIRY